MKPKRILVLTYWSMPDALIQTYTLPYVRRILKALPPGSTVDLFTLEQGKWEASAQQTTREKLAAEGIVWLPFRYQRFGPVMALRLLFTAIALWFRCFSRGYHRLHAWCAPAAGLGWGLSKFTGIPLVFDSFEPHADAMVQTGAWQESSIKYKILFGLERRAAHHAREMLPCTQGMAAYAQERYGLNTNTKKFYEVKPACVDLQRFQPGLPGVAELKSELGLEGYTVGVFAGKLGGLYYTQEVFDFLAVAYRVLDQKLKVLMLCPHTDEELTAWCQQAGLPPTVVVRRFVPHDQVPLHLACADFGLSPYIPVPSRRYATPIKNGEYWAMGLPAVIAPGISDDSDLMAEHRAGIILPAWSTEHYTKAAEDLKALLAEQPRVALTQRCRKLAENYRSFAIAEQAYQKLYSEKV